MIARWINKHIGFRLSYFNCIFLLAGLWLLAAMLVDPRGEFPLNDDWAYAKPVKNLVEQGRLEISQWPSMTLIAHLGWGWLFAFIFGFSFSVLRFGVALLGLGGVIAVFHVLRKLTGDDQKAILGALTIAFNGIYFNLAFTFMTDVPFFFCAIWSMYFYLIYFEEQKIVWLGLATLGAALAVLIRQIGLLLPAAFLIAIIVYERGKPRAWLSGIISLIFVYGVMQAYERWMELTGRLSNKVYQAYVDEVWAKIASGSQELLADSFDTLLTCLVYLGLFIFPVLLAFLPLRSRRDKLIAGLVTAGGLILACYLVGADRKMPLLPQGIFVDFALGPPTLRDVFLLGKDNLYKAPSVLLWLITFAGCVGAVWLLGHLCSSAWNACRWLFMRAGDGSRVSFQVFGFSAVAIVLLPLAIKYPFDRYLLACVPGLLIGLAAAGATGAPLARWQSWAAGLFILGSALFAVAGTHDYLAWNRARWQALDYLVRELKVPPVKIDGGFEFNGWCLYDPYYRDRPGKSWWWVSDDEFKITFGLIEDHHIMKMFPYTKWCPPTRDFVAVLERRDVHADHIDLATTLRHAGRNVKTRAGNIVRCWDAGTKKWPVMVAFGCYVELDPGRYLARFKLATGTPDSADEKGRGLLRVVEFANGPALAESVITARSGGREKYAYQDLPFTVSTNRCVEVQVAGGNVPLRLDKVEFLRTGD